jgi:protein-L-isoaspartate O-methyltransferase
VSPPDDADYRRLVDSLVGQGVVTAAWEPAFRRVPRGLFTPDRIWHGPGAALSVDRRDDPAGWAALVASDIPLTTKRDAAGVPVSSCSMPSMVATMLAWLGAPAGGRVLEIGTGTGWNAALLSAHHGPENVTSIELDQQASAAAATRLAASGLTPRLLVGDGGEGDAGGAPYDAIIATCAVRQVPPAWCRQVRRGGTVLTPFGTSFRNGCLLRLVANGDGLSGHFVDDASFIWMGPDGVDNVMRSVRHRESALDTSTDFDPRLVLNENAAHALGLALPDVRRSIGRGTGAEAEELTLWLVEPVSRSWAAIDYQPGRRRFEVSHHGPRLLHEELRAAYCWWTAAGTPSRFRFGLSVRASEGSVVQTPWLDSPGHPVPTVQGAGGAVG